MDNIEVSHLQSIPGFGLAQRVSLDEEDVEQPSLEKIG